VFQQGDSITIQSSTLNIGDAASGAYTITFYASDDLSYSEDDAPIATQERPSLPIGVSDTTPVNGAIPLNLTPG
jgi:hypothetical protein